MRVFLCAILVLLFSQTSTDAQCPVPNGDFETLGDLTDTLAKELDLALKFPVTAPDGWIPILRPVEIAFSDFIIDFFDKDTLDIDVFSGVESYEPGANGTEKALQLAGDDLAFVSDVWRIFACHFRPEKLTGYFKYIGPSERDSLSIVALLMNDPSLNQDDAIGVAVFNAYGGPEEFTKFEADFTYTSDENPDTAVILIASNRYEAWPQDSSSFIIDEITFEGGSVPTRNVQVEKRIFLTPNPITNSVQLSPDFGSYPVSLTIRDALGRIVIERENLVGLMDVATIRLNAGAYFATIQVNGQHYYQKLIKL